MTAHERRTYAFMLVALFVAGLTPNAAATTPSSWTPSSSQTISQDMSGEQHKCVHQLCYSIFSLENEEDSQFFGSVSFALLSKPATLPQPTASTSETVRSNEPITVIQIVQIAPKLSPPIDR